MSYTDIGFSEFLQRNDPPLVHEGNRQTNPLDSDYAFQQMSASKINGGVMSSANGRFQLDLNQGQLTVSNGTQNVLTIGLLPDGTIGFMIQDLNGNILAKFNGVDNFIQSSTARFVTDYSAEQFILKDDNDVPFSLFGRQTGGF